jgi:hypothetical protein
MMARINLYDMGQRVINKTTVTPDELTDTLDEIEQFRAQAVRLALVYEAEIEAAKAEKAKGGAQ